MATLTKKDLLEAIEDMPMDAEVWIDVCEYHSILRCITKVEYDKEENTISVC